MRVRLSWLLEHHAHAGTVPSGFDGAIVTLTGVGVVTTRSVKIGPVRFPYPGSGHLIFGTDGIGMAPLLPASVDREEPGTGQWPSTDGKAPSTGGDTP